MCPACSEERKNFKDYDPRWTAVMTELKSGKFGDKEYFQVGLPRSPSSSTCWLNGSWPQPGSAGELQSIEAKPLLRHCPRHASIWASLSHAP